MLADSYRKAYEQGKITQEDMSKKCKVLDFLGNCSDEDMYRMVDSTAFNKIIRAFCRTAIRNAGVDEEDEDRAIQKKMMNDLQWLFDEKTCGEVMNNGI